MRASPYVFCLVASALAASACGSEPSCPSGSVKNKKGVCESKAASEANMDGGALAADGDDALDEERDASTEGDACVKSGEETCNGLDDDCDGNVDEDLTGDSFIDRDKDGYGTGEPVQGCGGAGYASQSGDCDDGNEARSPGADEVCNGVDDDCDGLIDEGVRVTLYLDEDGDGHGLASDSDVYCAGQVVPNRVPSNADCDDKCPTCTPDNTQETFCDGKDDDCDGEIDEGLKQTFAADCDGDTFAATGAELKSACTKPATGPAECAQGTWTEHGKVEDCNDARADAYPGASEVCDGIDNDCNGFRDEAAGSMTDDSLFVEFSPDVDGDGYRQNVIAKSCAAANAHWIPTSTAKGIDCADGDAKAYPGSTHADKVPVVGGTTSGAAYDYNCNGTNEPVLANPIAPACRTYLGGSFVESNACNFNGGKCWATPVTCGASRLMSCINTGGDDFQVPSTVDLSCR